MDIQDCKECERKLRADERQKAAGWISVKERLPPMGVVFDVWDSIHNKRLADHGPYTGAWDDDFRRDALLIHGFTHWMVPEPPEIMAEPEEATK